MLLVPAKYLGWYIAASLMPVPWFDAVEDRGGTGVTPAWDLGGAPDLLGHLLESVNVSFLQSRLLVRVDVLHSYYVKKTSCLEKTRGW